MEPEPRFLTLVETEEYSAQCDALLGRYSFQVLQPILDGLQWGIATNPQAYDRTTWDTRQAISRDLGLTIPRIKIIFQIQNEGLEDEQILLLWIEDMSSLSEIMEPLA